MIADFNADLQFSYDKADETFWEATFRKAFPNMVSSKLTTDMEQQRKGIDRLITLTSGDVVKVEQKLRRVVYDDVLLEYISVDKPIEKPGWMQKDLATSFNHSKWVLVDMLR